MRKILYLLVMMALITVSATAQNKSAEVQVSNEKIMINGEKFYLHKVKKGETMYSICKAYNVEQKELIIHNSELTGGLKEGQSLKIPVRPLKSEEPRQIVDTSECHIVQVRRKHTLYALSKQYNVSIQEIYEANPGLEDKGLRRKDTIVIPRHSIVMDKVDFSDPVFTRDSSKFIYHTVKDGETLYRIGKQYDVDLDVITEANPELNKREIWEGEVIKIPKKHIRFVATFPKAEDGVSMKLEKDSTYQSDSIPKPMPDSILADQRDSLDIEGIDSLEIVVMLPFRADDNLKHIKSLEDAKKKPALLSDSRSMVQFYEGFLQGMDSIDMEGKTIHLSVYDTQASSDVTREILEGLDSPPDIIIGPVNKSNIEIALNYADTNKVSLVASVDPEDKELFRHKSLISIKPNSDIQYNFLAEYVLETGAPVVIVHDGVEENAQKAMKIKSGFERYFDNQNELDFLSITSAAYNGGDKEDLHKLMDDNDTTIVLSVSSERIFINRLMNALYQCKDKEIRLVGTEKWLDYNFISLESYHKVNFSYISTQFINYQDRTLFPLIENYRETFLDEPGKYAFIGLDVAQMLMPVCLNHGADLKIALGSAGLIQGHTMDWRFLYNHSNKPLLNLSLKLIGLKDDYSFSVLYHSD
ncbi:MAG: LysM peptidoglycan-binding domain-containing protein [Bacteroidales bacterium]